MHKVKVAVDVRTSAELMKLSKRGYGLLSASGRNSHELPLSCHGWRPSAFPLDRLSSQHTIPFPSPNSSSATRSSHSHQLSQILTLCISLVAVVVALLFSAFPTLDLPSRIRSNSTIVTMAAASSSSYLIPMPADLALGPEAAKALEVIEAQFNLDKEQLDKIVKQMLWEFSEGLKKHSSDDDRDTYLPMM